LGFSFTRSRPPFPSRSATNVEATPFRARNKIDQAIGRLKERYPRVARYFDLAYDPHTATLAAPFNADKYSKAEQLDGCRSRIGDGKAGRPLSPGRRQLAAMLSHRRLRLSWRD
jgi:hypothetical protein